MFKKTLLYSIIFTIIVTYTLPRDVFAQTPYIQGDKTNQDILELINSTQEVTHINSDSANIVVKETISEELSDVVETTTIVTEKNIIIETTIDAPELNAESTLLFDMESNEFIMDFSTEDENGELINQTYKVFLTSLSEDEFKAFLVNMDTGEILEVDSAELQASIVPVVAILVGFLVRSGLSWIIKEYGKTAIKSVVKDVAKKMAKKSLGKGSTGRQIAKDLVEELFMDHVLDDPLDGATEFTAMKLNDSRWHHSDGWVKMERKLKTKEGQNVVIHFVFNKKTKKFDDFKFKE
ncbi:SAR2788 family putative toxin [Sporosarcina sp. FSL K6-3457]|uniref:SAR2788 family putative toxin n=1 Tax=Sporosarcina sp. FSL K6-3457 TaxID=2978204 RepID=UPI0030FB2D46